MSRHTYLLLGTAMVGVLSPLHAQTVPGAGAPTVSAGSNSLQEVVVTAERRSVSVQKTSLAVTALSGRDLERKNVYHIQDLQYDTPGLTVATAGLINVINIRGIGLGLIGPTTTSGIVNYRDGALITHEPLLQDPYFDENRIEVLRGPQGTLAGSNSTGGAILAVSQDPILNQFGGFISQQYGNYNNLQTQAALNIPINDIMAVRLAGNFSSIDSFYRDIPAPGAPALLGSQTPGAYSQKDFRLSFRATPTPDLSVLLKAEYNLTLGSGIAEEPDKYSAYYAYGTHVPFELNYDSPTNNSLADWRTVLNLEYKITPNVLFRSTTAYSTAANRETDDSDATSYLGQTTSFEVPFNTLQQEFDVLSTGDSRFQWVAGAFGYTDKVYNKTFVITQYGTPAAPSPGPGHILISGTQDAKTYAFFGQGTFNITSQVQALVGLRWNQDQRTATNGGLGIDPPGIFIPNNAVYNRGQGTGKVGLNWNPDQNNLIFAFVAKGAKAGGYNTPSTPGTTNFGPETVVDYELGWKSTMLEQHLRTQLGGYYMDYKGYQYNIYNPITTTSTTGNAAQATIDGVEASVQALLGNFQIDGNGAYVHSSFGHGILYDTRYTPATAVEVNGKPLPFAPKLTGNLGIQYNFDLSDHGLSGTLTPRVQVSYVGSQWDQAYEVPGRDFVPSRTLVDLRLSYALNEHWLLEAYAQNVANVTYVQYINSGTPVDNVLYGAPRTFGAKATYNF